SLDLDTNIPTALGTPLTFESTETSYISSGKVDDNHFIAFWAEGTGKGKTQVFEVNLTTWAVTAEDSAKEFAASTGYSNSCTQVNSSHYINFWGDPAGDGFAQIFSINLGSYEITIEGTPFKFEDTANSFNSCSQ